MIIYNDAVFKLIYTKGAGVEIKAIPVLNPSSDVSLWQHLLQCRLLCFLQGFSHLFVGSALLLPDPHVPVASDAQELVRPVPVMDAPPQDVQGEGRCGSSRRSAV